MTDTERRELDRLRREADVRAARWPEVAAILTALRSHASIDRTWLERTESTIAAIIEGRAS